MSILKNCLHEFVYGGHLLSLGAASIVASVMLLSEVPIAWNILVLAYLISQIVYNNDHLADTGKTVKSTNPERTLHLQSTKNLQIATLILYSILFLLVGFTTTLFAFVLSIVIVIGGILYTKSMKQLTRKVVGFKNIYIALFWSALVFLVPLHYQIVVNFFTLIVALFVFVRWIINSAYFDIKDLSEDKEKGLKTLPVFLGLTKTLKVLHVLNIVSGIIVCIAVVLNQLPVFSLSMLVFPLYSFYYLVRTKNLTSKQLRLVSYFMVDGEYLFWPVVLAIAKGIFF